MKLPKHFYVLLLILVKTLEKNHFKFLLKLEIFIGNLVDKLLQKMHSGSLDETGLKHLLFLNEGHMNLYCIKKQ